MRHDIEIYYHPETPVSVDKIQMRMVNRDFSRHCDENDRATMEEVWGREVLKKNPKATSLPRGRSNLVEANRDGPTFIFEYVEYKEYQGVTNTGSREPRPLRSELYDQMRIGAVGAALIFPDDTVLVHRRSHSATHVAGIFDSSTAGVLPVDAQEIYLERGLYEKLSKELNMSPSEVTLEGVSGVHSAGNPDFSGLVTVVLRSHLTREEVNLRIKPGTFSGVRYVPRKELADFVVDRYSANDMNHDGAMTLLSSLPYIEWKEGVQRLQKAGKRIAKGYLTEGMFKSYEEI